MAERPKDYSYYHDYAWAAAQNEGVDPALFVRQIDLESGFDPNAISPAGAVGIAQIVPEFHPDVDPYDPEASLRYAARLMREYLDHFGGDYAKALAAYNGGRGRVDRGVRRYGDRWWLILPEETRRYLRLILYGG